jgi:hypothetical protein
MMAKWIRVEDQLPNEYEDVLLYIPSHGKPWFYYGAMCVGSYSKTRNCFVMDSVSIGALYEIDKPLDLVTSNEASEFMYNFEPSHWKKLPKRPYADWETIWYRLGWFFKGIFYRFEFYYKKLKEILNNQSVTK